MIKARRIPVEVTEEICRTAKEAEERFGFRCAVVNNPYRIPIGNRKVYTLSLLLFSVAPEDTVELLRNKVKIFIEEDNHKFSRDWYWHRTLACNTESLRKWFERFAANPEKFPIAEGGAGADLISPVIYGEKLISATRQEAQKFFGEDIIGFWEKEVLKQFRIKEERLRQISNQQIYYTRERRALLNRHTLAEMKYVVLCIAQKWAEKKFDCLVALDGSARPLGKAISWYLPGEFPIFYLDPRQLRKVDLDLQDPEVIQECKAVFERELPELYMKLVVSPRRVIFLDDQTGYGETYRNLMEFLEKAFGEKPQFMAMTAYTGNNVPSWLRKRHVQGIEIVEDRFTFLVREKPTSTSSRFYNRLQKYVLGWRKEKLDNKSA